MTRAHITALALILAVASWGPTPSARADTPEPPRLSRRERSLLTPLPGAAPARRPERSSVGPPYLAAPAKITFQRYIDNSWEIYVANGDGSGATRLATNSAADVLPRLNHGATRVAFVSQRNGNFEIYSVRTDGGDLRRLTNNGAEDFDPYWSPDGTKIAFSTKRDGNYEIYVMNADGSGVTRLTNNGGSDTEPAWSPDGTRIAFISDRNTSANTGGRVWVMNANGGNQHQVSNVAFSFDPVWSPSGAQIGFDGLANNDGWLDLIVMGAGGESPTVLEYGDSYLEADMIAGSWSPDGVFFAFTILDYIFYYDGSYDLEYATMWWRPLGSGNRDALTPSGVDMNPDWQWADLTPPTTAVQALPAVSPADFAVTWAGSATDGPAQQISYEVQSREGLTGMWTAFASAPWNTPNTKSFHGLGGRTYCFRSRGTDNATNVESWPADADACTTIEAQPPVSAMAPLDPFTRTTTLALQWSGTDPGGSGIAGYDLEYRVGDAGDWTRYLTGTAATSAAFPVARGNTYAFRARATDAAANIEDWPAGDGDNRSTIYSWLASGRVYDASSDPLESASVSVRRGGALMSALSNGAGLYSTLLITAAPVVSATWGKLGYGAPPTTSFAITQDVTLDVYLPPVDNVILNPDFEQPAQNGIDWAPLGAPPGKSNEGSRHTGARGLELGGVRPSAPANVSRSVSDSFVGSLALDPAGGAHTVWEEATAAREDIYHAERQPDGGWSAPEILSGLIVTPSLGQPYESAPEIGFDALGAAHVVWRHWPQTALYYVTRPSGGSWSSPQMLVSAASSPARMAVSAAGEVHLTWHNTGARSEIFYMRREIGGTWTPVENLTAQEYAGASANPEIAVDQAGTVHIAWKNGIGFYARKTITGTWSVPVGTTIWPFLVDETRLSVDTAGTAHVAWLGSTQAVFEGVIYARIKEGVVETTQLVRATGAPTRLGAITADDSGMPHIVFTSACSDYCPWTQVFHATPSMAGGWVETILSSAYNPFYSPNAENPDVAATLSGVWVAWRERDAQSRYNIVCRKRAANGQWLDLGPCSVGTIDVGAPILLGGSNHRAHMIFTAIVGLARDEHHVSWDDVAPGGGGIAQIATIPVTITSPGLSFLYRFESPADQPAPVFSVTIDAGLGPIVAYTDSVAGSGAWQHVWRDMTPWAGKTVTLAFRLDHRNGIGSAGLRLDEINLGSTYPDVWLDTTLPPSGPPGAQIAGRIQYGNRGAGLAPGTVLTAVLPPELSFLSADPPPSSTDPHPIWQLADLPGRSGPFTIQLTATVDSGATPGSTLTTTLAMATSVMEIELANNREEAPLFAGHRVYLPRVWR